MAWKKSPPELIAFFDRLVAGRDKLERRKMFGYPSVFMNGKHAAGLFEDTIVLRLSPADATAFAAVGAKPFEPMPGRKMGGYMVVPASLARDAATLAPWLDRAVGHAASLAASPTKKKPAKKAAAPR